MSFDTFNIVIAAVAGATSVIAGLIKTVAERRLLISTANSAQEPVSRDPLQPALDRLDDAKHALERQKSVARTNRWTSGFLTFGQYIIGGLLASCGHDALPVRV